MIAIAIPTGHLKAMLLFAAKQDVRYYLNGILVAEAQARVTLTATDGHRLLTARLSDSVAPGVRFIIPRGLAEQAVKMARKAEIIGLMAEHKDGSVWSLILSAGGAEFRADSIDGSYPDSARVIPDRVTGEAAQFQWHYLQDITEAARLMGMSKACQPTIHFNGPSGTAVSEFPGFDALAVVMPYRGDESAFHIPTWVRVPKARAA